MPMRAACIASLGVMALTMVGCGGSLPRGLAQARLPGYRLSFSYPASWRRFDCATKGPVGYGAVIIYLTTLKRAPACGGLPIPPGIAIAPLGVNGVFVSWSEYTNPALSVARFEGHDTTLGGRPARVAVITTDASPIAWRHLGCGRLGAGQALSAAISAGSPHSVFVVVGCLAGPNLHAGRAAVQAMLASVRFGKG